MAERAEVEAVVRVIKQRFGNLKAEEALALAYDLLEAAEQARAGGR